MLVSGSRDRTIKLWTLECTSYTCLSVLAVHEELIHYVCLDEERLYSSDDNGELFIWDLNLCKSAAYGITAIEKSVVKKKSSSAEDEDEGASGAEQNQNEAEKPKENQENNADQGQNEAQSQGQNEAQNDVPNEVQNDGQNEDQNEAEENCKKADLEDMMEDAALPPVNNSQEAIIRKFNYEERGAIDCIQVKGSQLFTSYDDLGKIVIHDFW